ncbi:hypothetical protein MVG78_14120 [Roseomonas gilardii subsp. gilardii]|uniref:hypothetical protein n=1 Tax=Roseomonas gilardii TaxID=257708 RepID=UPI001FF7F5E5|nr:hypothetical protein [Roseomonas gilardii]UPG71683.1 hypothetical protein MVG78_14120 [Roseomonas gilardii subsp. gilardii]
MWRPAPVLALALGGLAAGGAMAQEAGRNRPSGSIAPPSTEDGRLWFDPTQLPSFTGVVERYLLNPEGKIDRLLFREGPQIILPGPVGSEVERQVAPGQSIVVWGIRARKAPVIIMLAWAKDTNSAPRFVERPSWGIGTYRSGQQDVEVSGQIVAPLYTPQGDSMGVILQDGMVIRLPPSVAEAMGDRLAVGREIAASGRGVSGEHGRAVDAERIGANLAALGALTSPAEKRP